MQGRSLAEIATGAVILAVALLFLGYAVLNSGRGTARRWRTARCSRSSIPATRPPPRNVDAAEHAKRGRRA